MIVLILLMLSYKGGAWISPHRRSFEYFAKQIFKVRYQGGARKGKLYMSNNEKVNNNVEEKAVNEVELKNKKSKKTRKRVVTIISILAIIICYIYARGNFI